MKSSLFIACCLAAGFLQLAGPVSAHHGVSGYDMDKVVMVTGTVTSFDWSNPHCLVHIDVKDANGNVQHWVLETPPASAMIHGAGWTKNIMKTGDQVVADVHPAKNGAPVGALANIVINGKALPFSR